VCVSSYICSSSPSDSGVVYTQSSGTVSPNDRKLPLTPLQRIIGHRHGICIPAMDGIVFVFTTQRKDGGVERVSPSPSEGRIVEWYDRLPLLHLAPHDPLLLTEKDGHGRHARPVDDI
jgi:hypothetical protein